MHVRPRRAIGKLQGGYLNAAAAPIQKSCKFGHMNQILFKVALLLLVATAAQGMQAQSEAESATLVIERVDGSRRDSLHMGDRLNYQTKGGKMQRKGMIEAVSDSSVTIGGDSIALDSLQVLVHQRGKRKPAGLGLLVGSLVAEPISLLLFVVSLLFLLDNPSQGQRVIIGILAAFTLFIFPLLIILGIILLAVSTKRYDLRSGWKVRKG